MQFTLKLLVAAVCLTSFAAFAEVDDAPVVSPNCLANAADPYDPSLIITFGSYKNQCLDASTIRPPVVKDQDETSIEIANFYHNGRFWLAKIPKNAVASVQFQGIPFQRILFGLIVLAHGQLRFKLNQPILLTSQVTGQSEEASVDDLIISSTATHPMGKSYSVLKSGSFGIVTRILSTTGRAVEEISEDKSNVHQYLTDLTQAEMNDVFVDAILKASTDGYNGRYRLLADNCVTKTFDAWDVAIERPAGVKRLVGHWWQFHDEVEHVGLLGLRERKVAYKRVNNLNTEVKCAKPGEKLGDITVDQSMVGAASALCAKR
jgi:hypothetical protein